MKPRLIILVVLAGILATVFALRSSAPPNPDEEQQLSAKEQADLDAIRDQQRMIWEFDLPGDEPEEKAEFDVNVRVDTSTGKNRLVLEVSEEHGYYVEYMKVAIWYVKNEGDGRNDWFSTTHVLNRYLKAGDTLQDCIELVPAELANIGGRIGESQNWRAEIDSYQRARTANPKKFPPVGGTSHCDG